MEWTESLRKVPGQRNLSITTNSSRSTASKIAVVKIVPAVRTVVGAEATINVTAGGVVVEKSRGQIKARELSCQASEARAAE